MTSSHEPAPTTMSLAEIGPMLRDLRHRAGVSQREIGRRMGIVQPVVARWESGGDVPRVEAVARFARACGYEIDLTFRRVDEVDRAQIREHLALSPGERLRAVGNVARFRSRAKGIPAADVASTA